MDRVQLVNSKEFIIIMVLVLAANLNSPAFENKTKKYGRRLHQNSPYAKIQTNYSSRIYLKTSLPYNNTCKVHVYTHMVIPVCLFIYL